MIMQIPDRITIRLNEKEKLLIKELSLMLNEVDISKVLKFGLETSVHHINNVTNTLVSPNYDVVFMRKRKTQKQTKKIY